MAEVHGDDQHGKRRLSVIFPNHPSIFGMKRQVSRTMANQLYENVSYATLAYRALHRYDSRVAFIDGDREFSYHDSAKSVQVFRDFLGHS